MGPRGVSLDRQAPRYFGRRKSLAETRRLLLRACRYRGRRRQPTRLRYSHIPTAVHRTPIRPGGTHADRTVVAVVTVVTVVTVVVRPMMMCVCKCERT